MRCMRRAARLMSPPRPCATSYSLHFHHEPLEFGSIRVGIDDRGRELVQRRARGAAGIFREPAVSPMNRNSNLVSFLAIDHHWLDAAGHHGFRDVMAPAAGDFQRFPATDAQLIT